LNIIIRSVFDPPRQAGSLWLTLGVTLSEVEMWLLEVSSSFDIR